jgi:amino acid transporter
MIVSAFGALHANFLGGPRVPYAMAHEGNFFSFGSYTHPVFHTPTKAIIFHACIATVLVLTGTYQELYSYDMFATWAFFPLTVVALFVLRRRLPDLSRPYRVWGYPWTPLISGWPRSRLASTCSCYVRSGRPLGLESFCSAFRFFVTGGNAALKIAQPMGSRNLRN